MTLFDAVRLPEFRSGEVCAVFPQRRGVLLYCQAITFTEAGGPRWAIDNGDLGDRLPERETLLIELAMSGADRAVVERVAKHRSDRMFGNVAVVRRQLIDANTDYLAIPWVDS